MVRIEALEAFTALVEREIPALVGRTCAGQAPSHELELVPNLSIEPSRWTYQPDQADEHATLPGNVVVYDVGDHEASCVLSIIATSPRQRAVLEQQVIDLFLSSKHPLTGHHMPGVLVFLISDCPEVSRWSSSFTLDSDGWVETLAMDRRYESRIIVDVEVPALTVDRGVNKIAAIVMTFADIPASPSPPLSPAEWPTSTPSPDPEDVDMVTINIDGSLSPA